MGPDHSLDTISQNLEFLQAAGFPRLSCSCGGHYESSLVGFYHAFEQNKSRFSSFIAEQKDIIESSALMNMVQKIHLTYIDHKTIHCACRRSLTDTWSICTPEEWRNAP